MNEKMMKQMRFIYEIDRVKSIFRKTKLFDASRHENDAEHSWHLAVMAVILSEYANDKIDITKVIKMALIHDLPEIYAGDTMIYAKTDPSFFEKEKQGAENIFGVLPAGQGAEMLALWHEFEERKTPEAKFASALDRLEPVMQNYFTKADAWRANNIPAEKIYEVNRRIGEGSKELWEYAKKLIDECVEKKLIG